MAQPIKYTVILIIFVFAFPFFGCTSSFNKNVIVDQQVDSGKNSMDHNNDWYESAPAAFANAAATGRPLLLNFTGSDWCVYCQKLEAEVFETAEFKQWARQNVTLLKVDSPKRTRLPVELTSQNEDLKNRYQEQIGGFPTILFVDAGGSVIGKTGYARGGPENWIGIANSILTNR